MVMVVVVEQVRLLPLFAESIGMTRRMDHKRAIRDLAQQATELCQTICSSCVMSVTRQTYLVAAFSASVQRGDLR